MCFSSHILTIQCMLAWLFTVPHKHRDLIIFKHLFFEAFCLENLFLSLCWFECMYYDKKISDETIWNTAHANGFVFLQPPSDWRVLVCLNLQHPLRNIALLLGNISLPRLPAALSPQRWQGSSTDHSIRHHLPPLPEKHPSKCTHSDPPVKIAAP